MNKHNTFVFACVALGLAVHSTCFAQTATRFGDIYRVNYVEGEVLVKFQSEADAVAFNQAKPYGVHLVRGVPELSVYRAILPHNASVVEGVNFFRSLSTVAHVEPNHLYFKTTSPNDERLPYQWGMNQLTMPLAWTAEKGNPNVLIAILDTGVDSGHIDLAGKVLPGRNTFDDNNDTSDQDGHGTHCAGIAAAATNNSIGVAGVGWDCRILPVKVLNPFGTATSIANGILWSMNNGADVISMSIGGGAPSQAIEDAITTALNNGVISIAAAGNAGSTTPSYPAFHSNVIAVGSTNVRGQKAGHSNHGSWVDVAAPGEAILSTLPNNTYGFNTGTSMACPHVAGLAGLIISRIGAGYTPQQVRIAIESTTVPVGTWLQYGLVHPAAALMYARPNPTGTATPTSVTPVMGTGAAGTVADVLTSNNAYYQLTSIDQGTRGKMMAVDFSFTSPSPAANIERLEWKVEASLVAGDRLGGHLYAYNFVTGAWDVVRSMSLTTTDAVTTASVEVNFAPYVGPADEVRLRALVTRPIKRAGSPATDFSVQFDHLQLAVH